MRAHNTVRKTTQRHSFIVIIMTIMVLCAGTAPGIQQAHAQTPALFFTALSDIPAMNGLTELDDYTLVFDKPEGRIIEMVARLEGQSIEAVRSYYRTALPELGWTFARKDHFSRGNEDMILSFETRDGESYVRFTVQPH